MTQELLTKFKMKARLAEPMVFENKFDFPFTKLQLQQLDTDEKREKFLNSVLLTAEQMANKIFIGVDEKLILFFAAYLFVYQSPRSNFRLPDFYEIPVLDQDVPDEVHQIKNVHIQFGLYETAKNVKSNAAFFFCYHFAKDLGLYPTRKSDFFVEDLLAKIGAPFLLDEVETCKKFMVFDGRRPAHEPRLFLFDVSAGHIEALKIKNPIGTSYEYDDNFMAYGRTRGTFKEPVLNGRNLHFCKRIPDVEDPSVPRGRIESHFIDIRTIESDSEHIDAKLSACEKFIFI